MSSFASGSECGSGGSGFTPVNKKKSAWSRRSWSNQEEECLLLALKEIVAQGWRSDNGFKAGYLNKLEAAMRLKFPNTDLKGTPHINSKISQWKKNYASLQDILGRSGTGFTMRGDFMIEASKDHWDAVIKKDGNMRTMRYKPWPFYDDWSQCFGRDRANGETAEDMPDAAHDFTTEQNDPNIGQNQDEHNQTPAEEMNEVEQQCDSASQSARLNNSAKAKGKKRNTGGDMEMVCEALGEIGKKADARLCEMVKRMGFDFDVKETKKEAFRLLDFVPGLSIRQKFVVCQILAKEVDKLDVFMGLHDEERPSYVLFLLEEAGYDVVMEE